MTSSARSCIHALSASVPCSWYVSVGVEDLDASLDACARLEALGDLAHLGVEVRDLLAAPSTYVSSRSTVAPRK